MSLLFWIIVFSLIGSAGAIGGAGLLLLFPEKVRKMLVPSLVSYATGTLLGAALLGMLPKALEHTAAINVLGVVLAGMLLFFLLEKLVIWRHCHEEECDVHSSAGPLILIGDAFHNFVDGVVIAAAFLYSISLGITASLAVIAHEVPQEVGDFGILLDSGYSRRQALIYNFFSSVATLPGALITYFSLKAAETAIPYILAVSAASFIYIATADLIPTLHRKMGRGETLRQVVLVIAGVGTIVALRV